MTYAKTIAAFNELLEYNAYFTFEVGYTRTTGWTLFIGNSNTGLRTSICSLGAQRPALLWTQAAPVLTKIKAAYINQDEKPNWTIQSAKNSLLAICPAERLNKLCKIKEDGFFLNFSSNGLEFSFDTQNPNLEGFKAFVASLG